MTCSKAADGRGSVGRLVCAALAVIVFAAGSARAVEHPLTAGQRASFRTGERPHAAIRFSGGAALASAADPQCPTTSSIRLLLWDEAATDIALDCHKWRRTAQGYRYFDRAAAAGGVRKIILNGQRLAVYFNGGNAAAANDGTPFVELALTIGDDSYCGRFAEPQTRRAGLFVAGGPSETCQLPRPNIVVVLLDDVRADGVDRMPNLLNRIAAQGVTFDNAFTPDASCAPSRASLLTGQYALRHRTNQVAGTVGGADRFRALARDRQTIAVWLRNAGYTTGLFGKYINDYSITEQDKGPNGSFYIPPGWDRWWAFVSPEHYGGIHGTAYKIVDETGAITDYSDNATDAEYSTDLSAEKVRSFIADAVQRGQPFFAYWAPYAAHGETPGLVPAPAERHAGTFDELPLWRPPAWNEDDVSDKPRWVQIISDRKKKRPNAFLLPSITDGDRKRQYEALLSADEQLGKLLDQLVELGVDQNTLIVVLSDNGLGWGEHQVWAQKGCPYEECQRVPMMMRYPRRIAGGRHVAASALNIDIAPTLAAVAGVPRGAVEDGLDLRGWLFGPAPSAWRSDYLMEFWRLFQADTVQYTGQVADGDRIRLFYGGTRQHPRPSVLFEFDTNGSVASEAVAVPIGKDADQTFANFGEAIRKNVQGVRVVHDPNTDQLYVARGSGNENWNLYFWTEVNQKGAFEPYYDMPNFLGVRDVDGGFTWVEYETGERELYDLKSDPQQLTNRADDPAYAPVRQRLEARLKELAKSIQSR